MWLPEDKHTTRSERTYAIETDCGEEENEEQEHSAGEEDISETTASASVMAITGRSSSEKEPSSLQLEFDRTFADKVNKLTKKNSPDKMGRCPCNIHPPHFTKFGSARFCPRYLKIQDMEARRQFIRTKRLCTNCLRRNHSSASCKMWPLQCFYCKEALKSNSSHNASLCENFTNEEFSIIKSKFDQQRQAKEKENATEETWHTI